MRRWIETFVAFVALAGLAMISGPVTASGLPEGPPGIFLCSGFLSEALEDVELYTELPAIDNWYCVGKVSEENPLDHAVFGVAFEDVGTGDAWIVVNDASDEMGEAGWAAWLEDNGWGDAVPTPYGYTTAP